MDYSIGIRLKEFRSRTGVKMPEIEKATGISKDNLYKWEKGSIPRHSDDFIRLRDYLDKMEKEFPDSPHVYEPQRTTTLRLPLNPHKVAISQVGGKVSAGTVTIENDEPELIVDRIDAPFLGHVEGVLEVTDESMEPTFKKGCRIAITRLKDPQIIYWGECYFIIDKNGQGSLKRLYKGTTDDNILLVSDNPNKEKYPPTELKINKIEAILKVKACIFKY